MPTRLRTDVSDSIAHATRATMLNDMAGAGVSPIPFGEFFARRA
ncbi:hypothetical protein [Burkholderia ambifaria]|nr:hypothetical protein [Burkholderia ambifaria]